MKGWHNDGDGYQTYTYVCGHQVVASITTTGPVDIRKCRCGEMIPAPSDTEAEEVQPLCDT